jgi:hypothetical protein
MEKFTVTKYRLEQREVEDMIRSHNLFAPNHITFNWNTDDNESFVTITTEEVTHEDH